MDFTLNFYNFSDLSTYTGKAVEPGDSDHTFLYFYLTIVNDDSSTIYTLPMDAFVCALEFHSPT